MIEAAQILGCFSAVVLIVAIAAWVKLFRGSALQRLDGCAEPNVGNIQLASQLLVLAVSLSAVAALLALVGFIAT